jgi:hypothetical protein
MYTRSTKTSGLDLRCEFDVPRFLDLKRIVPTKDVEIDFQKRDLVYTERQEEVNFNWFHTEHDFNTPSSKHVEANLRQKILALSKFPDKPRQS